MDATAQEVAAAILEIVTAAGKIAGSQLALSLSNKFPSWRPDSCGARSLREFIGSHIPAVTVSGRAGMDVIYSLAETLEPETSSTSAELWRVWVSPRSPLVLLIDLEAVLVQAVPRWANVTTRQFVLKPLDAEAHRKIALSFLEFLPTELRQLFRKIAESSNPTWWKEWLDRVRNTKYLQEWNSFRHAKLDEALTSRLADLGLNAEQQSIVLRSIRPASAAPRTQLWATRQDETNEIAQLRKLAILAIQKMNASQLRALTLPLELLSQLLPTNYSEK